LVKFSAKEAFQATEHAKRLHDAVVETWFTKGAEAAMLHYQDILTMTSGISNGEVKAAQFDKLTGAREFLGVLLNLTEKPELPKPKTVQNLNHNA